MSTVFDVATHKRDMQEQEAEALGPVNKWYCSREAGHEVTDRRELLSYYIGHGGAAAFRARKLTEASLRAAMMSHPMALSA